jgi:hypothetical protein
VFVPLAEFLLQVRYLCSQLLATPHDLETFVIDGSDLLLTWVRFCSTTATPSAGVSPPWATLVAPILATLMHRMQLAAQELEVLGTSVEKVDLARVAAMLAVTSGLALGAFPLICRTCPLDQSQVSVYDWLGSRPFRQNEL